MNNSTLEQLRYPIGQFVCPREITENNINHWIDILERYPYKLEALVENLTEEQLETPYRPEGWTVRQLVHHIADSHHHSYIRFKWALTENEPLIKAYEEKDWAELFDSLTGPIHLSLSHLKAVHAKLVFLLNGLSSEDLARIFVHPDGKIKTSLKENIGRYAWHANHHYAHIENLLKRQSW